MPTKSVFVVLAVALLLVACGGKEQVDTKNMEQIHREEGLPVTMLTMQPQAFEVELTYNATLQGIRRTVQGSLIGGKVQAVLARVGDHVQRDQVLVEFEENNPTSQYQQAKAGYENARKTYEKMQALYKVGGISELDMDNTRTAFEVAEAGYNAARQMVKPQAPFSGIVTSMDVRIGDAVAPGDPLFTISQVDKMRIKLYVPESDIAYMRQGQPVSATWQDLVFHGKVEQIAYDMNRDMQGFGVDIVFDNPDNIYRSGMTALVSVVVYENEQALVVPRKLIKTDADGSYVYVAQGDKAEKRYVTLGHESALNVEVTDGLAAGDRVLATSLNLVKPGAKLNILN